LGGAPLLRSSVRRRRAEDNAEILGELITGYRVSQALHVVAVLGIADLLSAGPRSSDELAALTACNPDALYRLMRALARSGVFEEQEGRRFALTPLGEPLREDHERSRGAQAIFAGSSYVWAVWAELERAIRSGENAFELVHGQNAWQYRAEHPKDSAVFDAWMARQTGAANAAIVTGFDFSRFAHVVDVGGGHGALLAAILEANPEARGTLFDQEHVVANAPTQERMRTVAGSFFESVPTGADAYLLKSVIHDWADEEALAILRTCAASLAGGARLLLIERDPDDPDGAWLDLQMLVMLGGRERTADEYAELLAIVGLDYIGVTKLDGGYAVYEARLPQPVTT
jgi:O-methyltransferase domain/Dimerisation domain